MTIKAWHCEPPSYQLGQKPMMYPRVGDTFLIPQNWPLSLSKEEAVSYTNSYVAGSLDFPEGLHHTYVVCVELNDSIAIGAINYDNFRLYGKVVDVETIDFVVST
jgi:hypothetical protein